MSELNNAENSSSPSLDAVLEQAAFLGSFDPVTLLSAAERTGPGALLGGLAERCIEIEVDDAYRWALTPQARSEAFQRMAQERRLSESAKAAEASPLLDALGDMLVKLVVAPQPDPATLSASELDRMRIARSLLGDAVADTGPTHAINSEIERRSIDTGLAQLRSTELLGRTTELDRILDWLKGPVAKFRMMAISGMGGTGKSALLAGLVACLRAPDWSGQPVVWLDLDHPACVRFDPASLMDELLRQLALHPMFDADAIAGARSYLGNVRVDTGSYSSAETSGSSMSAQVSVWREVLAASGIEALNLVVICDTFEELLGRAQDEREQFMRLFDELSGSGYVASVQMICAGRELESANFFAPNWCLPLGELSDGAAAALFWRTAGLAPSTDLPVKELIGKFGGNPLVIKLLARQATHDSDALQDMLGENVPLDVDSEFVQGFLYTRILNRLRPNDPAVRTLAYPGLALRRVSAVLIRKVLAQACALGDLSEAASNRLFHELSQQFWLVQATPDSHVVLHRKDLRRLMLLSMDSTHADAIRQIHIEAIAFYDGQGDPMLSTAEQRLEADYHRLLLGQLPAMDTTYAHQLLETTALDLPCIPIAARAVLKLYAGRELGTAEVGALDTANLSLHQALVRERQLAMGQALGEFSPSYSIGSGLQSSLGHKGSLPLQDRDAKSDAPAQPAVPEQGDDIPDQSVQATRPAPRAIDPAGINEAFSLCEFEWLSEIAVEVAERTLEAGNSLALSREGRSLTESPLWQVSIACIVRDEFDALVDVLGTALERRMESGAERWNRGNRDSISFEEGIEATLRLLMPNKPLRLNRDEADSSGRVIATHERLRAMQLIGYTDRKSGTRVRLDVLNFMDANFRSGQFHVEAVEFDSRAWGRVLEKSLAGSKDGIGISGLHRLALAAYPLILHPGTELRPSGRRVLLGPTQELYPMVRAAFTRLAPEIVMHLCISMEQQAQRMWPRELCWDEFSKSLINARGQWIAAFIEYADRFGKLGDVLEYTEQRNTPFQRRLSHIARILHHRIDSAMVHSPASRHVRRRSPPAAG